jgi:protein TonB
MKKIIALLILFYSIDNFSQSIENPSDNNIYNTFGIDSKPQFPDGLEKLNSFIIENFQKSGIDKESIAKVYSIFVVEKDGSLSDIKILRDVKPDVAAELIKILKTLPKWIPGKHNGKIIRVLYSLPITFDK